MESDGQYDACMSIMMRLNAEQLIDLKEEFLQKEDGLDLEQFVKAMLRHLVWQDDTVVELVRDLIELFAQVDVNGDESMEWEEFTGFIVEAGMGDVLRKQKWHNFKYEQSGRFHDGSNHHIREIAYLPELKKMFVLLNDRPVLQIYDPTAYFTEFPYVPPTLVLGDEMHPLCNSAGYRKTASEGLNHKFSIQAVLYIAKLDVIVFSPGNLTISFWNFTNMQNLELPTPLAVLNTTHAQRKLVWCSYSNLLYTFSKSNDISVYSVHGTVKRLRVFQLNNLMKHTDIVQDLMLVNQTTLVSCAMDNLILLWDTRNNECKSTRVGHKRGVTCLERCSEIQFVSAGFELDILGWDTSGLSVSPIFRLCGHTSPVRSMKLVPGSQQLLSFDKEGWFRWWDIQQSVPVDDSERCLQAFQLGNDEFRWQPNSIAIMNDGVQIFAARNKLRLIERTRLKPKIMPTSTVYYNSVSFTILTATDKDIQIWDASSGELLREYANISATEITEIELDDRQRKFILGNQSGELLVFDYSNGSKIKQFESHRSEISSIEYCNEDKCLLTTSWDRSLRLFDDNSKNPLLRGITNAHDADITQLAYSYTLGLVATSSSDGVIKVWDYVYFSYEGQCSPTPSPTATSLAFFDPYPLLVSSHDDGSISFWLVRPWKFGEAYQLLHRIHLDELVDISVTGLRLFYDLSGGEEISEGVTEGRHLVVTADEKGFVTIYSISELIRSMNITAIPESKLPHTTPNYNPRRQVFRDGILASGTRPNNAETEAIREAQKIPATVVSTWRAHDGGIRSISAIQDGNFFITASHDKSVIIWSLQGESLGILNSPDEEAKFWNLQVDTQQLRQNELNAAKELWEKICVENDAEAKESALRQLHNKRRSRIRSITPTSVNAKATIQPEDMLESKTEQTRIFGQLQGKETWVKSDMEVAAEEALQKTQEKYEERMKGLIKKKGNKKSPDDLDAINEESVNDNLMDLRNGNNQGGEIDMDMPVLSSGQANELPFEHKDNWRLNSLNRQEHLYSNLYTELARSNRAGTTEGKKRRPKLEEPSKFLLEKLGPDPPLMLKSKSVPFLKRRRSKKALPEKKSHHVPPLRTAIVLENAPIPSHESSTVRSEILRNKISSLREKYGIEDVTTEPVESKKSNQRVETRKIMKTVPSFVGPLEPKRRTENERTKNSRSTVRYEAKLSSQTHFGFYTREEVIEVFNIFTRLDNKNIGTVTIASFIKEALFLNKPVLQGTIANMIKHVDSNDSSEIDIAELFQAVFSNANTSIIQDMAAFVELYRKTELKPVRTKRMLSPRMESDIRQLFKLYDKNKSGGIDLHELCQGLLENNQYYGKKKSEAQDHLTQEDLNSILQGFDFDNDKILDVQEFIELFRDEF